MSEARPPRSELQAYLDRLAEQEAHTDRWLARWQGRAETVEQGFERIVRRQEATSPIPMRELLQDAVLERIHAMAREIAASTRVHVELPSHLAEGLTLDAMRETIAQLRAELAEQERRTWAEVNRIPEVRLPLGRIAGTTPDAQAAVGEAEERYARLFEFAVAEDRPAFDALAAMWGIEDGERSGIWLAGRLKAKARATRQRGIVG